MYINRAIDLSNMKNELPAYTLFRDAGMRGRFCKEPS